MVREAVRGGSDVKGRGWLVWGGGTRSGMGGRQGVGGWWETGQAIITIVIRINSTRGG